MVDRVSFRRTVLIPLLIWRILKLAFFVEPIPDEGVFEMGWSGCQQEDAGGWQVGWYCSDIFEYTAGLHMI